MTYQADLLRDAVPFVTLSSLSFQLRGPSQDVPFFYTPSHLSELQIFKSIITTEYYFVFIFK